MKQEKIEILNHLGERLGGIKSSPENSNNCPAVILVHGFGGDYESGLITAVSQYLANHDYATYRFSFSGAFGSEGKYVETSASKQAQELKKIIDFVKTDARLSDGQIGLFAHSMGTRVAMILAPKVVATVFAGASSEPIPIVQRLCQEFDPEGISRRHMPDGAILEIGPQFWSDLDNHDFKKEIANIHSPILFIHGDNDETVPIDQGKELFKLANEPKQFVEISGADHRFRVNTEAACEETAKWFDKYLRK